jgi:hypothetical protein
VAFVPRLTAWTPAAFFSAVGYFLVIGRLGGWFRRVFVISVDLSRQFKIFSLFFFELSFYFI